MIKSLKNQYTLQTIFLSLLCTLLTAVFAIVTIGCSDKTEPENELPQNLRIGILPDESKEVLQRRYTPLLKHLSTELGVNYELIISENYQDLLNQFINKQVDLAYFGGVTYVNARHEAGAIPLVMRDIDSRFTSYFLSLASHPGEKLEDFKGQTFSFGSKLSTSGHYMPRFYMEEKGLIPESYFSTIKYSGAHDKTAYYVRDGIASIGVANSKIIDKMLEDKRLDASHIKIIWETPPYADYVWAVQNSFSEDAKRKLREAFLTLTPANEKHLEILQAIDSGGFIPASKDDFEGLYKLVYPVDQSN